MKNPLISVIVPVYNAALTVEKTIDCIINQSYKNIEIICVNDKSTDNTAQVLASLKHKYPQIIIINHNVNKRAGGARNTGLKAAKGEYICFVDSDDWMSLDAIEIMVEACNDSTVDIVFTKVIEYKSEKNQVEVIDIPVGLSTEESKRLGMIKGFRTVGSLIKRRIYIDYNLYYPEGIFYEDNPIDFTLILCAKSIHQISTPLYYYNRTNDLSTTFTTNIKKIDDRIYSTDLFKKMIIERDLYTLAYANYVDACYLNMSAGTIELLARISFFDGIKRAFIVKRKILAIQNNENMRLVSNAYKSILENPVFMYLIHYLRFRLRLRTRLHSINNLLGK